VLWLTLDFFVSIWHGLSGVEINNILRQATTW